MILITDEISAKLLENAQCQDEKEVDLYPVVKLFTPDGAATWLFTEGREQEGDFILFGLCDLGMGEPELGYVSLNEILSVRGGLGLSIERDLYFEADKTLMAYWEEARKAGVIVT